MTAKLWQWLSEQIVMAMSCQATNPSGQIHLSGYSLKPFGGGRTMNDMICRNNGAEIYELIDEITNMLVKMTQAERLEWFRRTQYPHPIHFETEISGTVYSVNAHFDSEADESLQEKAQRIILKASL
jgi:hypothetical protein